MSKEIFPTIIVKDSAVLPDSFQNEMRVREENAKVRRAHQDKQASMSKQGVGVDGSIARLGNNNFIKNDAPRLVLTYRDYHNQQCIAEATMVPKLDKPSEVEMMFTLVCLKCVNRGVPMAEAQLMVRESHRKFWIDDRPQHKRPQFVEHVGVVNPAGVVSTKDTIRCSNFNCGWTIRINDSVVEEI